MRRPPTINMNLVWRFDVTSSTVALVSEMIALIVETPGQYRTIIHPRADTVTVCFQLIADVQTLAIECLSPKNNIAFNCDTVVHVEEGGKGSRGESSRSENEEESY